MTTVPTHVLPRRNSTFLPGPKALLSWVREFNGLVSVPLPGVGAEQST